MRIKRLSFIDLIFKKRLALKKYSHKKGSAFAQTLDQLNRIKAKIEASMKKGQQAALNDLKKMVLKDYSPNSDCPIIFIAGGCSKDCHQEIMAYASIFNQAFASFSGTLISGGTDIGISRLVGDLDNKNIQKIAYVPSVIPQDSKLHSGFKTYTTTGKHFSTLEPTQAWIDLLAGGIKPSDVKLVGINGGDISAFEYRIALSLGAKVGVFGDSGRAVQQLIDDPDWNSHENLYILPNNNTALNSFIQKNNGIT